MTLWIAMWLLASGEPVSVKSLKVTPPPGWEHIVVEGSAKWVAPSGEAYFTLDVGQTASKMTAKMCVEKITKAVGGKFTKLTLAKQPAGKKEETTQDDAGKEFISWTYVGCNGVTTWSVQFHAVGKKKAEYQGVAGQVVASIEYK
ncbi:MAG: hypothetical protein ACOZIN_08330 [Myxococcota bacterium]